MNTTPTNGPGSDTAGPNEAWLERAVALLEHSAQNLDASTLSRLNRARQAALAQRRRALRGWWIGGSLAGAALALAVAIGIGNRLLPKPSLPPDVAAQAGESDPLADDDSLDLYENLDFYAWLDAQQQDGNG